MALRKRKKERPDIDRFMMLTKATLDAHDRHLVAHSHHLMALDRKTDATLERVDIHTQNHRSTIEELHDINRRIYNHITKDHK